MNKAEPSMIECAFRTKITHFCIEGPLRLEVSCRKKWSHVKCNKISKPECPRKFPEVFRSPTSCCHWPWLAKFLGGFTESTCFFITFVALKMRLSHVDIGQICLKATHSATVNTMLSVYAVMLNLTLHIEGTPNPSISTYALLGVVATARCCTHTVGLTDSLNGTLPTYPLLRQPAKAQKVRSSWKALPSDRQLKTEFTCMLLLAKWRCLMFLSDSSGRLDC